MGAQAPVGKTGLFEGPEGALYFVPEFTYDLELKPLPKAWRISPGPWSPVDVSYEELQAWEWEPENPVQWALLTLAVRYILSLPEGHRASLKSGRTKFFPFQFRPLLKYLSNPQRRILISDEAGLGKTIETGYILVEEMARGDPKRIVILCPSHLRYKWRRELWWRFGLPFRIVDGRKLLSLLGGREKAFYVIASIDSVRNRQRKMRKVIDGLHKDIDCLVIDEAHHVIGRSRDVLRREFALRMSARATGSVLLTATPIQLEQEDLARLLMVVDPSVFEEHTGAAVVSLHSAFVRLYRVLSREEETGIRELTTRLRTALKEAPSLPEEKAKSLAAVLERLEEQEPSRLNSEERDTLRQELISLSPLSEWLTRTRRVEVDQERRRHIRTLRVELDSSETLVEIDGKETGLSEKGLFEELESLFARHFSFKHRCQLSSCAPAMTGLLEQGARGVPAWPRKDSEFSAWILDEEDLEVSGESRLRLDDAARERCRRLLNAMRIITKDSKWEQLQRLLHRIQKEDEARKVVVFTEWRPTLRYFRALRDRIRDIPVFFVSGADSGWRRYRTVRRFEQQKGFAVLFCSDVLSEGLDLVEADCIVNYDLPVNPQRLEQRIGRLDRIGQRSDEITVYNLLVQGGQDERTLELLLERIGAFERTIGSMADTLVEKLTRGRRLDDEEVVRVRREIDERGRIEETSLLAVDGFLDEEISTDLRKGRSVPAVALRELLLAFVQLLLKGSKTKVDRLGDESLKIGPPPSDFPLALGALCGPELGKEIGDRLQAVMSDGAIFTFESDVEEGYLLPFAHPLIRGVAEVVSKALSEPDGGVTLHISNPFENASSCWIVEELSYRGVSRTATHWLVCSMGEDKGFSLEPSAERLATLLKESLESPSDLAQPTRLPSRAESSLDSEAAAWFENQRSLDLNETLIRLRNELRRLEFLRHLEGQNSDSSSSSETGLVGLRIDEIREKLIQLEHSDGFPREAVSNDRHRILSVTVEVDGIQGRRQE